MSSAENPYQPPSADTELPAASPSPPPPEEPLATFESANRKVKESARWKVRVYPGGLHVAPGLGTDGFWVSREQFLERGVLTLGLINALQVPLPKKPLIPIDAEARRILRRWLHPDEGRLLARAVKKQRLWLLFAGVLWVWGALPTARHPLDLLALIAGGVALTTALVGLLRPVRLVFLGEGAWVALFVTTLVRQLLGDGGVGWNVLFLLLAALWMGTVVAQFRFFAPLAGDEAPD